MLGIKPGKHPTNYATISAINSNFGPVFCFVLFLPFYGIWSVDSLLPP